MKKLNQLLADITAIKVVGNAEVEITSVTNDSREAKPGALFIAVTLWMPDGIVGLVRKLRRKKTPAAPVTATEANQTSVRKEGGAA